MAVHFRNKSGVIAVTAVCCAAAALASAHALLAAGTAPATGVSAGVSAFADLPQATASPSVAATVARLASSIGMSGAAALRELRALRTGVGPLSVTLYGFAAADGSNCIFLPGWVAGCGAATEGPRGTQFVIGGGWPARVASQTVDVPSTLAGIVSDDVSGAQLSINGVKRALPIRHNSYVATLPDVPASDPWHATLSLTHTDGSTTSVDLPNPAGD